MAEESFIQQRSKEWFAERLGKFTASTFNDLLGKGRAKGEEFTLTGQSLIKAKVAEKLTGTHVEISGKALEWGTENEPAAIEYYEELTGLRVNEAPFIPLENYEDWAGGSPDGFIEGVNGIIEVKCPYVSGNHIEALITGDIPKKSASQYYTQMQFNMWVTQTDFCDFISYDPRMIDDIHKMFVKRIPRDDGFILILKKNLDLAILEMKTILANI